MARTKIAGKTIKQKNVVRKSGGVGDSTGAVMQDTLPGVPYIVDHHTERKRKKVKQSMADVAHAGQKAERPTSTAPSSSNTKIETKDTADTHSDGEGAQGNAAQDAAQLRQTIKKKNKKRRRKDAGTTDISPEELERRKRQSQLRQIALKLRAEGTQYKPRKHKAQLFKKENAKHAKAKRKEKKGRRQVTVPQVIIIPIFWIEKPEEKAQVFEAAKKVQQLLASNGVTAELDDTNQLKPGQKFRFWEHRGVKLRVEIGPNEARAGSCVLAKCGTPGEVASKLTMLVGDALVLSITQAIAGQQGKGKPVVADKQDVVQDKDGPEQVGMPQATTPDVPQTTDTEGQQPSSAVQGGPGVMLVGGGDDLEDDFALDDVAEEQPKKKKNKGNKTQGNADREAGWVADKANKKQKVKVKVVKF